MLCAPLYLIDLGAFIWCLLALSALLIIHPFYLLNHGARSLRERCIVALAPLIQVNLSTIYVHTRTDIPTTYSLSRILIIILSFPITSFLLCLYTQVASVFWLFTLCVGDPKNSDNEEKNSSVGRQMAEDAGKYNDGRNAIMFGRKYWRKLITWPIR
jgi:hypothetical protein